MDVGSTSWLHGHVVVLEHTEMRLFVSFWQRITAPQIYKNEWFRKGYTPAKFKEEEDVSLDDVVAVFSDSTVRHYFLSETYRLATFGCLD